VALVFGISVLAAQFAFGIHKGAVDRVSSIMEGFGPRQLMIVARAGEGGGQAAWSAEQLKALRLRFHGRARIGTYHNRQNVAIRLERTVRQATVYGADPECLAISGVRTILGRTLTPEDEEECRRVCVVGPELLQELEGESRVSGASLSAALNKSVFVDNIPFTIVGIQKRQGVAITTGRSLDRTVWTPFQSGQKFLGMSPGITVLRVDMAKTAPLVETRASIEDMLKQFANCRFSMVVIAPQEAADRWWKMTRTARAGALALALLAVLATGSVVASVSSLWMRQRRSEMALKRALGASRQRIILEGLLLFVLAAFCGGVPAALAGAVIPALVPFKVAQIQVGVSWLGAAGAFLVALFFYMFAAFHGIRNAVAASPGVSLEK
jgi:putative ABC transport system permease protein